ncbi:MAG: sugar phosphate isomerase/epimerase [Verrucomicrobia bacterium]|nr:MAG: sugar phosphate isomerase/epimerase [Verrucomicrobiota bacterium]
MKKVILCMAAVALSGLLVHARNDAAAEQLGWKLGSQAYTFRALSFFETVDKLHELGIKYVEMYPGQALKPGVKAKTGPTMTEAETADMQAKLQAAGVKVVSFGVAPIPDKTETEARRRFAWGKKLGIETFVTETVPTPMLDKLSQEYGIKIALHNHPKTWPSEQVLTACAGLSKNVGSCSDTGHWKRAGHVPVEQLKKLEGRIIELHFKDVAADGKGKGGYTDRPWGTGEGNVKAMLAELKRQGFKGHFQIEYEHGTVPELMRDLPLCIEYFDKEAAELAK